MVGRISHTVATGTAILRRMAAFLGFWVRPFPKLTPGREMFTRPLHAPFSNIRISISFCVVVMLAPTSSPPMKSPAAESRVLFAATSWAAFLGHPVKGTG